MNYYRRFLGDYASKTASLSLAEHGAYNVLLDIYYSTETPLPLDHAALFRLCRAMDTTEQKAVVSVANKFFPEGEDGLRHNPRADEEIAKGQAAMQKQIDSGYESAAKRWSGHKKTDRSTNKSTDESSGGLQIQPPSTNHHTPTTSLQPKSKAMSGKPDYRGVECLEILDYLNRVCVTAFKPVKVNLDLIKARLKEYDVATLKRVVDYKAKEWEMTDQAKYLRPSTLFNATKCAQYVGQLDVPLKNNGTGTPTVAAKIENCAGCGEPLKSGFTQTQKGKLCSPCWSAR